MRKVDIKGRKEKGVERARRRYRQERPSRGGLEKRPVFKFVVFPTKKKVGGRISRRKAGSAGRNQRAIAGKTPRASPENSAKTVCAGWGGEQEEQSCKCWRKRSGKRIGNPPRAHLPWGEQKRVSSSLPATRRRLAPPAPPLPTLPRQPSLPVPPAPEQLKHGDALLPWYRILPPPHSAALPPTAIAAPSPSLSRSNPPPDGEGPAEMGVACSVADRTEVLAAVAGVRARRASALSAGAAAVRAAVDAVARV